MITYYSVPTNNLLGEQERFLTIFKAYLPSNDVPRPIQAFLRYYTRRGPFREDHSIRNSLLISVKCRTLLAFFQGVLNVAQVSEHCTCELQDRDNDQENITTEAALRRATLFEHRVVASLQFFLRQGRGAATVVLQAFRLSSLWAILDQSKHVTTISLATGNMGSPQGCGQSGSAPSLLVCPSGAGSGDRT